MPLLAEGHRGQTVSVRTFGKDYNQTALEAVRPHLGHSTIRPSSLTNVIKSFHKGANGANTRDKAINRPFHPEYRLVSGERTERKEVAGW
jgi:hypothetical protein